MKTLFDILEDELGVCDTLGIDDKKLNAFVEEYDIDETRRREGVVVISVRFDGWNNPLTHPYLRNPETDGWFELEFGTDNGSEWFFYDFG